MKISCLTAAAFFGLFTYWQLNDVTQYHTERLIALLWIASYATIAILSAICAFKKLPPALFLTLATIPLIIAAFRFTYIDWTYDNILYNPQNPAANETGGLLIMTIWLLTLFKINKTPPKNNTSTPQAPGH